MTDSISDRDDEIVSAVLDGEATPDEVALVEADPALTRRRDELARVRDLVAEPVPPLDEVARRRLVVAALSHAPQRELPWWRRGNLIGVGSAAAVVLVLAVLVGPAILGGISGEDSSGEVASVVDQSTTTFNAEAADDGATGYSGGDADDEAEMAPGRVSGDTGGASSLPDDQALATYTNVAAFDSAVRQRYQERSALDSLSPAAAEEAEHYAERYGQLVDELFIRCGLDFIEEHLSADAELVDQVEAVVAGRRLVALTTVEVPPPAATEPTVKIIDPERCEAVTP